MFPRRLLLEPDGCGQQRALRARPRGRDLWSSARSVNPLLRPFVCGVDEPEGDRSLQTVPTSEVGPVSGPEAVDRAV